MKTYTVKAYYTVEATQEIEAKNEAEAIEKAKENGIYDDLDLYAQDMASNVKFEAEEF